MTVNGIRPHVILEVLRALESAVDTGDARPVLATMVSLDGSVYGRAGAMALFVSGFTSHTGVISLSELSQALREQADAAAQ